jgi:hypothetical protein
MANAFQVDWSALGNIFEPFQVIPVQSSVVISGVFGIWAHANTGRGVPRSPFNLFCRLAMTKDIGVDSQE